MVADSTPEYKKHHLLYTVISYVIIVTFSITTVEGGMLQVIPNIQSISLPNIDNKTIEYNSLGQKISQTFTDSRNDDFKSSSSKTLTETYTYDKEGGLKESKLTTPDYIVRFNKDGKQIGDTQETASFKAWKEAEIAKARKKAEHDARKKAEAAPVLNQILNKVSTNWDLKEEWVFAGRLREE